MLHVLGRVSSSAFAWGVTNIQQQLPRDVCTPYEVLSDMCTPYGVYSLWASVCVYIWCIRSTE
jgi:hypothetical protein